MTFKEEEALNQWLDEQLKVEICGIIFLYSKGKWFSKVGSRLQEAQSSHNKE